MPVPLNQEHGPEKSAKTGETASAPVASQSKVADSPLATQLPSWNLVLPHNVLVRRRSAKVPSKP